MFNEKYYEEAMHNAKSFEEWSDIYADYSYEAAQAHGNAVELAVFDDGHVDVLFVHKDYHVIAAEGAACNWKTGYKDTIVTMELISESEFYAYVDPEEEMHYGYLNQEDLCDVYGPGIVDDIDKAFKYYAQYGNNAKYVSYRTLQRRRDADPASKFSSALLDTSYTMVDDSEDENLPF